MTSYNICLYLSDLLQLIWLSLGSSMLLQMALFHSFYGSVVFHCVCVCVCVCVCLYHIFFIHSSVDGHLGYFHGLAIENSAAVNIGMHVFFRIMVFFWYVPRTGIFGSYGNSIFNFLRNLHFVLHSVCTNLQSHQEYRRFHFLYDPSIIYCL